MVRSAQLAAYARTHSLRHVRTGTVYCPTRKCALKLAAWVRLSYSMSILYTVNNVLM